MSSCCAELLSVGRGHVGILGVAPPSLKLRFFFFFSTYIYMCCCYRCIYMCEARVWERGMRSLSIFTNRARREASSKWPMTDDGFLSMCMCVLFHSLDFLLLLCQPSRWAASLRETLGLYFFFFHWETLFLCLSLKVTDVLFRISSRNKKYIRSFI